MRGELPEVLRQNPALKSKIAAGLDVAEFIEGAGKDTATLSPERLALLLRGAAGLSREDICDAIIALAALLMEDAGAEATEDYSGLVRAYREILCRGCWLKPQDRLSLIAELTLFERFCMTP